MSPRRRAMPSSGRPRTSLRRAVPWPLRILPGPMRVMPGLLGPSGNRPDDLLGMARRVLPADAGLHMPSPYRSGRPSERDDRQARSRDLLRSVVIALTVVALVLTSSALNWVSSAQAAEESPGPRKAVVVAGPVHSLTSRFKGYAKAMADAAEAQGMDVKRIFHPNATPYRVRRHAQGAHLFIYVGHGNGWPSQFGPFQERTKNGLGLNPTDPDQRTTYNVNYKGADWLKEHIEFAPHAVVILSHLSYASGNASSGMAIPTRDVAVQRIDNFANGFLASGARVVWALGWQPGADVIDALHEEGSTMDAVFMTRYRDGVNPLNGWIGWRPGYYASVRTPGAEIHIDPDPQYGYLRGITGDLQMTTTQWRNGELPPEDTEPPVLRDVSVEQSKVTVATGSAGVPIFTPNGDGLSDTIEVKHTLSESAFLDVRVTKASNGNLIRRMSVFSLRGRGSTVWDGRRDDGDYVGESRFKVTITPRDRAGNDGEAAEVAVKVLSSLRAPKANPGLFDPTDGDELASRTALRARLTRAGTVSWLIRDASGSVVRRAIDEAELGPGTVRFMWDGTDDQGQQLPQGRYVGRVRVTRDQGTYGHDVVVRMMPFQMRSSRWTLNRGEATNLTIWSAEPMKGKPLVTSNQPGIKKTTLRVRRINAQTFKATLKTRNAGKRGVLKVRITGTDTGGGTQAQIYQLNLR